MNDLASVEIHLQIFFRDGFFAGDSGLGRGVVVEGGLGSDITHWCTGPMTGGAGVDTRLRKGSLGRSEVGDIVGGSED